MTKHWTTQPTVQECRCGDWTLTGVMLSGREITLSLDVFTPVSFATWASTDRKPLYTVVNGGVCLVRAGDGSAMGEWRREHTCPFRGPQSASQALSPRPASPTLTTGVKGPQNGAQPVSETVTLANGRLSELDGAIALLKAQVGAVVIEREHHGRIVYRDRSY